MQATAGGPRRLTGWRPKKHINERDYRINVANSFAALDGSRNNSIPVKDAEEAILSVASKIDYDTRNDRNPMKTRKTKEHRELEKKVMRTWGEERQKATTALRRTRKQLMVNKLKETTREKPHERFHLMEYQGEDTEDRTKWKEEIDRHMTEKYNDETEQQEDAIKHLLEELRRNPDGKGYQNIHMAAVMEARTTFTNNKATGEKMQRRQKSWRKHRPHGKHPT